MTTNDREPRFRATHAGFCISGENVTLPPQTHQHSEDHRRFAHVGEESGPDVDRAGGSGPIVGVVRDEEGMAKPRCRT